MEVEVCRFEEVEFVQFFYWLLLGSSIGGEEHGGLKYQFNYHCPL